MSEYRPHQRGALTIIALLLLPFCVNASDELVPQRIQQADFYLYDTYIVGVTSGSVSNLSFNISIPIDGVPTQIPPGTTRETDADGNPYLTVWQADPSLPYNFTYNLSVHTQFQPLTNLPAAGPIPEDFGRYLASTPAMPASDPAIRSLAANITADGRSDFERIALLAQWVHDGITYDASAANQNPDTTTILATRRGVCTEYSVLFVTLARSLGYPSRFVNGYAYASTLGVWQAHSWAEVWLGKWVAVDPTWLEAGSVDATHIVISRSALSDFNVVSVSGLVHESSQLILNGGHTLGAKADNVHLVSEVPAPAESNYELSASSPALPSGGLALIWVSYPASDYRIMSLELAPCSSKSGPLLTSASPARQRLITAPNQTYYVVWLVQAASQIDPHYTYNCPLTLNSESLGLKTVPLSLRDNLGSSWPALSADLERSALPLGGKQTVFVHLPAAMAGETVHLLEPTLLFNASVNGAGEAKFEFIPALPGNHTLYVFSSRGDPLTLSYSVLTAPAPAIASASANQSLIEGEPAELIVELDGLNSSAAARPFTLAWSGDGESGQENVSTGSSQSLRIPISPSVAGDFVFSFRLIAADGTELASRALPLKVWPAGDVAFASLQPQSRTDSGWQVELQFTMSGEVRRPQLLLGGTTWEIPPDGRLMVAMAGGSQPASVSWQDVTGAAHSRDILLEIQSTAATPVLPPETGIRPPLATPSKISYNSALANLYGPGQNVLLPAVLVFLFFGLLFGGAFYSHIRELRELYRSDAEAGRRKGGPKQETGGPKQETAKPEPDDAKAFSLSDLPKLDLKRRQPPPPTGEMGV